MQTPTQASTHQCLMPRVANGQTHPPQRSGADLRAFTWLGGGHAARPLPLRVALCLARGASGLLLVSLLLGATFTAAPLAVVAWVLLLAGATQWTGKRIARHLGAPRPYHLGLSPNHLQQGARGGWPSSHAVSMACVSAAVWVAGVPPLLVVSALLLTLATGWARIYAGAHFPSDVLAGWGLGLCGGTLGMALATPWLGSVGV